MIAGVIVGCEVAFWLVILAGLLVRYPLHRPRLGLALLACVPLVDLALLAATAVDLRSGATARVEHGVAAIYVGFSLAYGHSMIHWADVRFAHRFAAGPAPQRLHGAAYTRHCWDDVVRTGIAAVIAGGLTAGLVRWVGDPGRTGALSENYTWLGLVLVVELLWALSYTWWPKKARA